MMEPEDWPGEREPRTGSDPGTRPWLVVVARGQGRLARELVELFRDDPRVRVIEDRRDQGTLMPRPSAPGSDPPPP